ncbi:hypothetical protein PYW07_013343 [Mythimna separata]|uniref:Cilia- and flagella-associated protein 91 n=1 Tax=Mythimna separata TaxID=271217 RepID=A0AAD8DK60_MYTSE|nr:hypothetical protein PYW07_013343 [Mythimna separata]
MSGVTLYETRKKHTVNKVRSHDYLYDSAFIVSGARDYARTAFRAAMASSQVILQPVYNTMFSDQRKRPRINVVYYPNCRLPEHMDRSYNAYLNRQEDAKKMPTPELSGKDCFKFTAMPKTVMPIPTTTPDFRPNTPTIALPPPGKPRNRGTQSVFRESSAQTRPWQPDGKPAEQCQETPEVLYLDSLEWGPGSTFRLGDLPADFHTTEIINKMRHARAWMDLVEGGKYPRWMKKRDAIIDDVVVKDWLFRQAEIDELQNIRLELLHRLQAEQRQKQCNRTSQKLAKLWHNKKQEMDRKVNNIRKTRDRELRKLVALHEGGGRIGLVNRMKSARGMGNMIVAAKDPTSDLHAPLTRHGYQARRRHAEITYDPALLSLEDHKALAEPPEWLTMCGQDLTKTCSGHHLTRDPTVLCERQTKWSEQFLENLHNDLIKARLGAAKLTAGPLHVLKMRHEPKPARPATPVVEAMDDAEETVHQAALVLQKIIRGRAVQNLMYEGRTRAAELTEELKTTHGLQKEDKVRIANEESKAREFKARRTETELKEDTISALVDELCGGAVSAALSFLEKELRRLKEERRQHAFLMIALREKTMREAAEAGRRQREEHRRREHDEMFKQILGVTQGTVEAYLQEIIEEGVELAAEEDARLQAEEQADKYTDKFINNPEQNSAATNELVAELVHQFLLPHTTKTAARLHITQLQNKGLETARKTIFGLLDDAETKKNICGTCGEPLLDNCRCPICPLKAEPTETKYRDDPRWKLARNRPKTPKMEERYPMAHEMRCMLTDLLNDVVKKSRRDRAEEIETRREIRDSMDEKVEITLDVKHILDVAVDVALGLKTLPVKAPVSHYFMRRERSDALPRSEPFEPIREYPELLPSELRRLADEAAEAAARATGICQCDDEVNKKVTELTVRMTEAGKVQLLPSQLRELEEMRKCKCDAEVKQGIEEEYTDDFTSTTFTEERKEEESEGEGE